MQWYIDREREERRIKTGWFATIRIPAFCIYLAVHMSEEERFLLHHSGIGRYFLFQAPIPPEVTDLAEIAKLKAQKAGLFFVRDLAGFGARALIGAWPGPVAADVAEAALRMRLEEIADHLARVAEARPTAPPHVSCDAVRVG